MTNPFFFLWELITSLSCLVLPREPKQAFFMKGCGFQDLVFGHTDDKINCKSVYKVMLASPRANQGAESAWCFAVARFRPSLPTFCIFYLLVSLYCLCSHCSFSYLSHPTAFCPNPSWGRIFWRTLQWELLGRAASETADMQQPLYCRRRFLHTLAKGCELFVCACNDEHVMLGRSWSLPSHCFMAGMWEYWI